MCLYLSNLAGALPISVFPGDVHRYRFHWPWFLKVHGVGLRLPLLVDIMALPNNVLVRVLESLYADFLKSDECIDIGRHHCSLLHPCISISKSTTFKPIHTFRLVSSNWNKIFLETAKLDQYGSHLIVQDPHQRHTYIYDLLRKSVVFRRYRIFQNLDTKHGNFEIVIFVFFFLFSN